MKILVIGTGGVGAAFAEVARRRNFFERIALADLDASRAESVVAALDDPRYSASGVDASSAESVEALIRE